MFGLFKVSCGAGERPEVSLTIATYTGDVGQPKKPEDVVAGLKGDAPNSTVTELARKAGKDGGWRVEYSAAAKHGATAFGFDEVRLVGATRLLCAGSAWSRADLDAAVKMCGAMVATK